MLYACDSVWWNKYGGVPRFEGLKYTQDDCALVYPTVRYIESVNAPGLSFNRAIIHQGGSSGYQAINLAVHFGVKRIILLGYDNKSGPDGQLHHHPNHPTGMNNPTLDNYTNWAVAFGEMESDLNRAGVAVINCSLDSALDCFPKARLEDVL